MTQQEVQSNHFDNFLAPELQKAGYTAIYKRKTTELYTGSSYAIDGCATFFKRDKFALVKKYEVQLLHHQNRLGHACALSGFVMSCQASAKCIGLI